jgi:hypothetical protein
MSFTSGFSKHAESLAPKTHYGTRSIHKLDPEHPGEAWSAKIDGAHTIIKFKAGKLPDLFSHRQSKRTGGKIDYTAKLPNIKRKVNFDGQFRGETYAVDPSGKAVEPEVVTSILNRGVDNSLRFQKEHRLKTRVALINVDKYLGKSLHNATFEEKRNVMEQVAKMNPDFTLPALATTPKAKLKLKEHVLSGEHPQSREGLIVHRLGEAGSPFAKAKIFKEHDVYVRDIFKEESTTGRKPMAGGFYYSWTPDGEIKGRVGSGFDHAEKEDMLKNPNRYIGLVARVQATNVSKNKVLLKPSFKHWHVEKNIGLEKAATIFAKQSIIIDKTHEPDRDKAKEVARGFADKIYTSRGTKTQWRFRQRPPGLFIPGSFRHAKIKPGVSIIYGQIDEKRKRKTS